MEDAVAVVGAAAVNKLQPPPPTCPVCLEPWTCNGGHRICCIPCGHVYGRSCLERWLHRSSHASAKCPQCGEQFEDKLITNLYAPGNLWDGCCRLQELEANYKSIIKEMEGRATSITVSDFNRFGAEMKEAIAKFFAELKGLFSAHFEQAINNVNKSWNEKVATANAGMTSMKDQMKKMAEEENATATDLVEFMERNFTQLCYL
ncbi:hypothetical protein QYE76_071785 [Lolium multiflorum]|uniref:RING-type domain-containing protein n=1 Tax=Lolium multiflorum TaxID=4521 RepID=A0AAD8SKG6_LOLMU|nr:hypothetical protein QYE76_071785 [Lolium multiflorum]